jgi:hypothetical protein
MLDHTMIRETLTSIESCPNNYKQPPPQPKPTSGSYSNHQDSTLHRLETATKPIFWSLTGFVLTHYTTSLHFTHARPSVWTRDAFDEAPAQLVPYAALLPFFSHGRRVSFTRKNELHSLELVVQHNNL